MRKTSRPAWTASLAESAALSKTLIATAAPVARQTARRTHELLGGRE